MKKTKITFYSHFFTVDNPNPKFVRLIYHLSMRYTQYEWRRNEVTGRNQYVAVKTFAIYAHQGRQFRFLKGQWKEMENALSQYSITPAEYEYAYGEDPVTEKVDLPIKPGWNLYPQQIEAKSFVLERDGEFGSNSPLLMMPVGTGKTVTSLITASELGHRLGICVLKRYKDKWVSDVKKTYDLEDKDIVIIDNGKLLRRATAYPGSNLPIPKVFIFTLSAMTSWYDLYEESPENPLLEAYDCKPHEFFSHLGIGTLIFDEVHQHPHVVYRVLTYTHTDMVISLSATLLDPNPIIQRVQSAMFPKSARYENIQMKKYIKVIACQYQIRGYDKEKIRTSEWGSNMYSQVAFEASILRNKKLATQYIERILYIIEQGFVQERDPRDRLGIFVGRETMAEALVAAIRRRFPQFDTRAYLQKHDYANLLKPDIRVTTIMSGGTGADIPNLRYVILTNSIQSPNSNIQVLGRLRELPDRDVTFYYLFCSSIPKQVEYHETKRELFEPRVLSQGMMFLEPIMAY